MHFSFTKKIIVTGLLVALLAPGTLFIKPQRAHAFLGFGDIVFDPSVYANIIIDTFREEVLDGIAWAIAKAAVAQITQQTIDWINNDFDGNPLYITNLNTYYAFICTETFNEFMNELKWEQEISPESKRVIARSLLASRPCAGERSVTEPKTIASEVLDDYYRDFRRGGWSVWRRQITNPSNTIYGQYAQSRRELSSRLRTEASNKEQELDWGRGFLGSQRCDNPEPPLKRDCDTVTPGSLIEERLAELTTSDIKQLNLADSINEIASALLNKLIEEAFVGAQGLLESDSRSRRARGAETTATTDPELLQRSRDGIIRLLNVYIENENTYRDIKEASLEALAEAQTKLNQLEGGEIVFKETAQQEINESRESIEADLGVVGAETTTQTIVVGGEEIVIPIPSSTTDPIQVVINRLNRFKTQVEDATSLEDINTISQEFGDYKSETHTSELATAQGELDEINTLIAEIEERSTGEE